MFFIYNIRKQTVTTTLALYPERWNGLHFKQLDCENKTITHFIWMWNFSFTVTFSPVGRELNLRLMAATWFSWFFIFFHLMFLETLSNLIDKNASFCSVFQIFQQNMIEISYFSFNLGPSFSNIENLTSCFIPIDQNTV